MSGLRNSEATRERILKAAEALFAERGFGAVSLRDITARGLANVAAVNYHFGTKEALWEKVLMKVIGPLNEARCVGLDGLGRNPSLENVIGVWLDPLFFIMSDCDMEAELCWRLMGRFMDGEVTLSEGGGEQLMCRWVGVLRSVLGDVKGFEWRLSFVMGAVRAALMGSFCKEDGGELIEELKKFCVSGLNGGFYREEILSKARGSEEGNLGEDESPFVRSDVGEKGDLEKESKNVANEEKVVAKSNDDGDDGDVKDGLQNEFLF